jgi:hypothetical protein
MEICLVVEFDEKKKKYMNIHYYVTKPVTTLDEYMLRDY